LMLLFI